MNVTVARDKRVGFTTNREVFSKAKEVAKSEGTTISSLLNLFINQLALTGQSNLMSEEEILLKQLQAEIKVNQEAIERGEGVSLEEVKERFGL